MEQRRRQKQAATSKPLLPGRPVFEGLVKPDPDGNFVDAVASSHDISEDGLTYTFTVRDGVIFHNGAQCTADDVLYSFETCAASTTSTAVAGALSDIADISADGNVVAITLNAANSSFLSTVSSVSIVPTISSQNGWVESGTESADSDSGTEETE